MIRRIRDQRLDRIASLAPLVVTILLAGAALRLIRPTNAIEVVNTVVMVTAFFVWQSWFSGGRAGLMLARRQSKARKAEAWVEQDAALIDRLFTGANGCLLLVAIAALTGVVTTFASAASRTIEVHVVWFLGTPISLSLMIADSLRSRDRPANVKIAIEQADELIQRLSRFVASNRTDRLTSVQELPREHLDLPVLSHAAIGGDAGHRHLRRVSRDDADPNRRLAADLLLEQLSTQELTSEATTAFGDLAKQFRDRRGRTRRRHYRSTSR